MGRRDATAGDGHLSTKAVRFNPPPGWLVPAGFFPDASWRPDPSWPPAPLDWQFWIPRNGISAEDGYVAAEGEEAICQICGGFPATAVNFQGLQGLILVSRVQTVGGRLCKSCGLSTGRKLSGSTLLFGWWSPKSLVHTPIVLLMNSFSLLRLGRLAPPSGSRARPLDPGRSLWLRFQMAGFILPVGLLLWAVHKGWIG
jgi:hypothetical protein